MKTVAYILALLLLAFSYPYLEAYYSDSNQSSGQQADPNILLKEDEGHLFGDAFENEPRIISAQLLEEQPDKIVVGLEYLIPPSAPSGLYNLSVHPDMSHWSYTHLEVMSAGRQYGEITVSFRPQKEGVTEAESTKLLFYLSYYQEGRFIRTYGNREAAFPKTWRAVP